MFPVSYMVFTVVLLQQYTDVNCLSVNRREHFMNMLEKILAEKMAKSTEDKAWEFLGIPKCSVGEGWQCFPGKDGASCFNGITDTCNGVIDCNCEETSLEQEMCVASNDESSQACQIKEEVQWIMDNGIPRFGYGEHDSEIFSMLWIMGLRNYCPANKATTMTSLSCPSDPNTCINVDQFCDGVEHCSSLCYELYGYQFCGTNDYFGGCMIKETVKEIAEGLERKR
ncbi:uncharacterized protein [Ptychodera flava]|uniref:uncharacterized protein n=1 Tax=Ptychodera flava TaxID=63121 RepID=UPI00396A2AE0